MYEYPCKIKRVIDGDTVDVDIDLGFDVWLKKQRVRLYGVDTPESRTSDKEEKKYDIVFQSSERTEPWTLNPKPCAPRCQGSLGLGCRT